MMRHAPKIIAPLHFHFPRSRWEVIYHQRRHDEATANYTQAWTVGFAGLAGTEAIAMRGAVGDGRERSGDDGAE